MAIQWPLNGRSIGKRPDRQLAAGGLQVDRLARSARTPNPSVNAQEGQLAASGPQVDRPSQSSVPNNQESPEVQLAARGRQDVPTFSFGLMPSVNRRSALTIWFQWLHSLPDLYHPLTDECHEFAKNANCVIPRQCNKWTDYRLGKATCGRKLTDQTNA